MRAWSLLDDLDALAGGVELPVLLVEVGIELAQRLEAVGLGLQHLADQVFLQREIVPRHGEQRQEIVRPHRQRQVEQRTVLQELGREAGIGPEQEPALAVDIARVEVGHRHRRRAAGRHAVDLGHVARGDLLLAGAQPDAAHREAGEAVGFGNAGLLQQGQRRAAGAEENVASRPASSCRGPSRP